MQIEVANLETCTATGRRCKHASERPCSLGACRIFAGAKKQPVFRVLEDILKRHGRLVNTNYYSEEVPDPSNLRSRVRSVFEEIERRCDSVFGTQVSLRGTPNLPMNREYIVIADFDNFQKKLGEFTLPDNFYWDDDSGWQHAASAYQREAGWDFAPDEAGIWLAAILPSTAIGEIYTCDIVGFIILQDRDKDGRYESVAHLWTAEIARRKGVASRLLTAARETFPLTTVEGPATSNGLAFLKTCWPESVA